MSLTRKQEVLQEMKLSAKCISVEKRINMNLNEIEGRLSELRCIATALGINEIVEPELEEHVS